MTIFVMITTESSARYTEYALSSFYSTTPISDHDQLVLIDNDSTYQASSKTRLNFSVIANSSPLGFSDNMNEGIRIAIERNQDVVLLNNDLIFTSGWSRNLFNDEDSIISPLSTREITYSFENFSAKNPMDLEDYLGHELVLEKMAEFTAGPIKDC